MEWIYKSNCKFARFVKDATEEYKRFKNGDSPNGVSPIDKGQSDNKTDKTERAAEAG